MVSYETLMLPTSDNMPTIRHCLFTIYLNVINISMGDNNNVTLSYVYNSLNFLFSLDVKTLILFLNRLYI